MGIIFTPYIGFGLGSSIRQLTYEFNNARMLHIKGPLSKIIETIPLEGAHAKRVKTGGFLSNLTAKTFDVGDVVIIAATSKETFCPNIKGVQAFMQAVEGTHPDVQPIKPHEYENFVICIPEISKTLDRALYAIHPKPVGRVYPVKPVGEHVKKGDGIAVHTSFIVSPVEGKIAYMGYQNDNGCDWPQGADWPRSREWADPKDPVEISFTTKSKIQPLKGSFVAANYIADSYQHAINLIEKNVFNDPPKRFRTAMLPDWQNEVAQALIILKNAKARIEHLSDPTTNPNVGM